MDCPYPDCDGEVVAGEEYCPECGRSVAPLAVRSALAGVAALNSAPTPTIQASNLYRPPIAPAPIQAPHPRPANPNFAVWLTTFAAVGCIMLLVSMLTTVSASGTGIALPAEWFDSTQVDNEFDFQLSDISANNNWSLIRPLRTNSGQPAGSFMIKRGASYAQQGAGDKIVTLIVAENNRPVVELAASQYSAYAGIRANWVVAQQGATITSTMPSGLTLALTTTQAASDPRPLLSANNSGNQPAFTNLALHIHVTGNVKR